MSGWAWLAHTALTAAQIAAWWTLASVLAATTYSLARTHEKRRSTR